jgi:hypothetical protein
MWTRHSQHSTLRRQSTSTLQMKSRNISPTNISMISLLLPYSPPRFFPLASFA